MAAIAEDRIERIEDAISQIQGTHRFLKWAIGALAAVMIAGVSVNLNRNFTLADRMSDVRVEIKGMSKDLGFVREKTSEISGDVKGLRQDVARVSSAVDKISGAVGVPSAPSPRRDERLLPKD